MLLEGFNLHGKEELLLPEYCRISIVGSDNPSMMETYWAIEYVRCLVHSGVIIVGSISVESRIVTISTIAINTAIELGGHGVMISRRSFDQFFSRRQDISLEAIGNVHLLAWPSVADPADRHKRLRGCNYFAVSMSDAILVIGGNSVSIIDQVSKASGCGKPIFWHRRNCKPPQEEPLLKNVTIYSSFNHRRMGTFLPRPLKKRGIFHSNEMRNLSQFKRPIEWRGLDG